MNKEHIVNSDKKLLYSVVIPVYNVKEYLVEAVNSVLDQKNNEYEIILVDDGSTDGSETICDFYSRNNECVKVIHQENAGLSGARNRGIREASGEYIIFLDSDDRLCNYSLDELKKCIVDKSFPDIVAHRRAAFNDNERYEYPFLYEKYIGRFDSNVDAFTRFQNMPKGNMGAWNFTIKKGYIEKYELYFCEGIYHEDEEWVPRIFFAGGVIYFSDIVFYEYRLERAGSITSKLNPKRIFDKLSVIERLQSIFSLYDEDVKYSISNRCASIYFGILCQMYECQGNIEYRKMISEMKKKQYLLRESSKSIHRITFLLNKIMGTKLTAMALFYISKRKRKEK